MLTLAEELLLLALDEAKGSAGSTPIEPGLSGALLVDLGRLGALRPEGRKLHPVEGVEGAGIEHPVLARAAAAIAGSSKPRTAKAWVGRLPRELKPLLGTVARPLVEAGILDEQQVRLFGLFPATRFPEADPGPERRLRLRLHEVLLGGRAPQEQDALLLGLLEPLGLVGQLVDRRQRREARKRAKEIATNGIAGKAVSDAVRDIQAAVMVAVIVPVVTDGGGGNGGGG